MPKFPTTSAPDHAHDGPTNKLPNPKKSSGSEHSVMSSNSAGFGHNDSMNRMEHPFRSPVPTNESGEGKN